MEIVMLTEDVLKILKGNREKHIKEHKEQIDGWKYKMEEFNVQMKEWADKGGEDSRPKEPFKPQNYVETYDKYINMLTNHYESKITLSEYEYEQFINDEFIWKRDFDYSNSVYNSRN